MRKRSCCRVFSAVSLLGGIAQNGKSGAESKIEGAEAAGTRVSVFQRFHSTWGTLCALLRCGTCWACREPPGRWTGGFIWSVPFSLAALGFHKAGAPYVGGGWCFFCTCCMISGPSGVPPAASASFSMVVLGTGVQSCHGVQVLP